MTAIAYVYTQEGFVVGADGRRRDLTGQICSEKAVKLFSLARPRVALICGWAHAISFPANDRTVFDLSRETLEIESDLTENVFEHGLADYVVAFCKDLYRRIQGTHGPVLEGPLRFPDRVVANALIVVYVPTCSKVMLKHRGGNFMRPEMEGESCRKV